MRVVEIIFNDEQYYVYLNGEIISIQNTLLQATKKLAAKVKGMS